MALATNGNEHTQSLLSVLLFMFIKDTINTLWKNLTMRIVSIINVSWTLFSDIVFVHTASEILF